MSDIPDRQSANDCTRLHASQDRGYAYAAELALSSDLLVDLSDAVEGANASIEKMLNVQPEFRGSFQELVRNLDELAHWHKALAGRVMQVSILYEDAHAE